MDHLKKLTSSDMFNGKLHLPAVRAGLTSKKQ